MKIGVMGLGSMGRRRVRDLSAMGHAVVGWDVRVDRRRESEKRFGARTVTNEDDLWKGGLDALVISLPPDLHVNYYEKAFRRKVPFFSEANIFTPSPDWFRKREMTFGVKGFPSTTWRHYPLLSALKRRIDILGRSTVQTVIVHYGGFLPNWHPGESYSEFYAGRRKTSAAREMVPFEVEWMTWIFGRISAVSALRYRSRDWLTDMDDTYYLLLEFNSGIRGILTVELHQVAPWRVARVSTREEGLTLDFLSHVLDVRKPNGMMDRLVLPSRSGGNRFNFEDVYRAEISMFVRALSGEEYPKTWEDDRHLSDVLYAAELSAKGQRRITIDKIKSKYDGNTWE